MNKSSLSTASAFGNLEFHLEGILIFPMEEI